ncbi:MAG: MBL fold metallo-hydrolase [Defluviitaleaceae bacterium]|nr:MBL fold metallo-hydrolase [Defluviitaleaceae bacterium]
MNNIDLITLNNNSMQQNAYIYCDIKHKMCVVIDPGYNGDAINSAVDGKFEIAAILLTHGHYDHIMDARKLNQTADIYCHEDEAQVLEEPKINLSTGAPLTIMLTPNKTFKDGDTFKFGTISLTVLHIPGHTPGGACYYDAENAVVFTGDSLFKHAVGYTSFPLSDETALITSIKSKLLTLPNNTTVYPGHDEPTTIGEEKLNNPFVRTG